MVVLSEQALWFPTRGKRTLRRQRALPATGPDLLYPPVSRVKEGMRLVIGQRAPVRLPLELGHSRDRVPLIKDLPRRRRELLQALARPPVASIGRITAEQPQRVLVVPGRGNRDRRADKERLGPPPAPTATGTGS